MVFFYGFLQLTIDKAGLEVLGPEPNDTGGKTMSLLSDGVYSSVTFNGIGDFKFSDLQKYHQQLIRSISKRQRAKYARHGIVPRQILTILWDNGYLPGDTSPGSGMKVERLFDLLHEGRYSGKDNYDRAMWLYDKLVIEELMPVTHRHKKKSEKGLFRKYTKSQLRDIGSNIFNK